MNIPQLLLLLITLVSVVGAAYVLARDYVSKRRRMAVPVRRVYMPHRPVVLCNRDLPSCRSGEAS